MMDNEKKNKKKKIKNKIKNECAFLYYIAYNKDEKQTKEFLHYFTNSMQYTLLRELVVNDLAENISDYNMTKIKNVYEISYQMFSSWRIKKSITCIIFIHL